MHSWQWEEASRNLAQRLLAHLPLAVASDADGFTKGEEGKGCTREARQLEKGVLPLTRESVVQGCNRSLATTCAKLQLAFVVAAP